MLLLLPPAPVPYVDVQVDVSPVEDMEDDLRAVARDVRETAASAERLARRLQTYTHPAVVDGEYPARA